MNRITYFALDRCKRIARRSTARQVRHISRVVALRFSITIA
jgi:hypothetical protein